MYCIDKNIIFIINISSLGVHNIDITLYSNVQRIVLYRVSHDKYSEINVYEFIIYISKLGKN